MDRNTVIGLVMIVGIFLTWSIFFNRDEEPDPNSQPASNTRVDSTGGTSAIEPIDSGSTANNLSAPIENASNPYGIKDSLWTVMSDSEKTALAAKSEFTDYGHFGKLREGEDKTIRVETDMLIAEIGTKGGYIRSLFLKSDTTYDGDPLPIIRPGDSSYMSLRFGQTMDVRYPLVNTADLFFSTSATNLTVTGSDAKSIVFHAQIDDKRFFEYVYTFRGDKYDYDFEIRHNGLTGLARGQDIRMNWATAIPKTEKAMRLMRDKTAVYYRQSGDVDNLSPSSSGIEEENMATGVDWLAFKSQFFSHTLMTSDQSIQISDVNVGQYNPMPPDPDDEYSGDIVKIMYADFPVNLGYEDAGGVKYTFFAGPLDFDVLKKYDRSLTRQIELGWGPLKLINQYGVIPLFNFLEGFIGNYGIIILILAILIKMVLYPLTFRTYKSTAKMRIINQTPEIKELEEKFKDEPTKLQQEKMGIYRKMGVSMLGGCWPMLLQYPFLIALFFFFPNSFELRGESFLWAEDLSTYDSILELGFNIPFYGDHVSLFTLLMTISIFAFTIINQQAQGTMTTNPVMKYFPYFMPIIFLGFLNNYSAGLSWYYLISNLISITQTVLTKRFIDEDALLEQMHQKSKARQASGKKTRVEKFMEKQQQKQRAAQGQRGGGGNESRGGSKNSSKGSGTNMTKKKRR
jgi:YidC/Oxa1 family membrane protein insertase